MVKWNRSPAEACLKMVNSEEQANKAVTEHNKQSSPAGAQGLWWIGQTEQQQRGYRRLDKALSTREKTKNQEALEQ